MHKEVVICGAGIAGIATAFELAVRHNVPDVLLLDERPPLSLTSDKSSECYRNFWPGPDDAMVQMMNRSIDLLEAMAEKSHNIFQMNRRGYIFATGQPDQLERYVKASELAASYGVGLLRVHRQDVHSYVPAAAEGFRGAPDGADILVGPKLIRRYFPYLTPEVTALLHIRRAGWLSAQQLGTYMLEEALAAGVQLRAATVEGVECQGGSVHSVRLKGGDTVRTAAFVNAGGPLAHRVADMLDIELPIRSELHLKSAIHDTEGILPRDMPMAIWGDDQYLAWQEEERAILAESEETSWLLDTLPSGAHTRPDGGGRSDIVLMLWEYNSAIVEPGFPIPMDDMYPEIVLRGLTCMIPGLNVYLQRLPKPVIDGGYYTKTRENRPLAGPMPVRGSYILGALSGFGIMSAPALAELVAAHITQNDLPEYAPAFELARYGVPAYQQKLEGWGDSWQL